MPTSELPAPRRHNRAPIGSVALLSALIAILALFTSVAMAQGDSPSTTAPDTEAPATTAVDADPIVIRVGDLAQRLSDIEWRFEVAIRSFAAGQGMAYSEEVAAQMRPMLPNYLEQRGTELVLLREAARRGLVASQENVDLTLENIRGSVREGDNYEDMLAAAGFKTEQMLITLIEEGDLITQVIEAFSAEVTPTDDELRVRYLSDIGNYTEPETYCARHILVDDEAVAEDLVERVAAGEDFASLAAEFGTDGTASVGGDLGCFGTGAMVEEFASAVVEAEIGTVSGPVQTQFGYHALLVYDHHDASVAPFEEVKDQIEETVVAQTANARVSGLLRGAGIITYPERLPGL